MDPGTTLFGNDAGDMLVVNRGSQIFVNGTHVGGFDDLVAADRSGRLRELTEAGA